MTGNLTMNFDMTTEFGGLKLKSPVVVGSCPLTSNELQRIAMVVNGAGALVMPSLVEPLTDPSSGPSTNEVEAYVSLVKQIRQNLSIPLIASLRSQSSYDWGETASQLEDVGADAIELSVRKTKSGKVPDPRIIEDGVVEAASKINNTISIPLFVKLTRKYTSISDLAMRLRPHIQGLILFGNAPIVDIHLDSRKVYSQWELTDAGTIGRSLESIMRIRESIPDLPLAACGGIGNSCDLIKSLLAGADVAMATSAIYRDGPTVIGSLLDGLTHYLNQQKLQSLEELRRCRPGYSQIDFESLDHEEKTGKIHLRETPKPTMIKCDRYGHPHPAGINE